MLLAVYVVDGRVARFGPTAMPDVIQAAVTIP
jgi:hypothetical protein